MPSPSFCPSRPPLHSSVMQQNISTKASSPITTHQDMEQSRLCCFYGRKGCVLTCWQLHPGPGNASALSVGVSKTSCDGWWGALDSLLLDVQCLQGGCYTTLAPQLGCRGSASSSVDLLSRACLDCSALKEPHSDFLLRKYVSRPICG